MYTLSLHSLTTLPCYFRPTCSGNDPLAVSPLSITQSAPSRIALATSDDSARVGRGFLIMLSSIWVAQTIGFPARLQRPMHIFCARKIFSVGISMPRSPRATITPSVASRISSNRFTPSWFSIFEMILMLRPLSPNTCQPHNAIKGSRVRVSPEALFRLASLLHT